MKFYFFALAARGEGLSGSDRIFIELARRWSKKFQVEIFLWEEGLKMCRRQGLEKSKVKFHVLYLSRWQRMNFFINYLSLITKSIWIAFKLDFKDQDSVIIYSASDFWMDSLPGWILKFRFPRITWVGSWYLTAPNLFKGYKESSFIRIPQINSTLYWFSQRLILYILRKWADFIFVTSEPDQFKFPQHLKSKRILIVKGGVDLRSTKRWQRKFKNLPKIYDAVFQGRFHPQKGVIELVDIWKLVVRKKHDAKLIMIGDGPLRTTVKSKIEALGLEDNIILFGYRYDNEDKFKILCQSRIIVHPATYDSGGMAAAEAMVLGLPGVSFDLESLKTYYPEGMLKAPKSDIKRFSTLIVNLLENNKLYQKISLEAETLISKNWSWDKRAGDIIKKIV